DYEATLTDAARSTVELTAIEIGASDVNAFVGTGWVDADGDGALDAGADAIGLTLEDLEFGIALLKPKPITGPDGKPVPSPRSYFALTGTAGTIGLVGVDDVTLEATSLSLEINSASDKSVPAGTVVPVVDFSANPLDVPTGPSSKVTLGFSGAL